MEKINILKIFKDHFRTLIKYDTKKCSFMDILLFYILPLEGAIFLSFYIHFKSLFDIASDLMVFYAGSAGFLLNVLVLIYGYNTEKFKNRQLAEEVLKETSSNIAYLISVAAFSIILLFLIKISKVPEFTTFCNTDLNTKFINIIKQVSIVFICFSLVNFFLTMLMVLKRFYSLDSNRGK